MSDLTDKQRRVLDAMRRLPETSGRDMNPAFSIALQTGMSIRVVGPVLTSLWRKGLVERDWSDEHRIYWWRLR